MILFQCAGMTAHAAQPGHGICNRARVAQRESGVDTFGYGLEFGAVAENDHRVNGLGSGNVSFEVTDVQLVLQAGAENSRL